MLRQCELLRTGYTHILSLSYNVKFTLSISLTSYIHWQTDDIESAGFHSLNRCYVDTSKQANRDDKNWTLMTLRTNEKRKDGGWCTPYSFIIWMVFSDTLPLLHHFVSSHANFWTDVSARCYFDHRIRFDQPESVLHDTVADSWEDRTAHTTWRHVQGRQALAAVDSWFVWK